MAFASAGSIGPSNGRRLRSDAPATSSRMSPSPRRGARRQLVEERGDLLAMPAWDRPIELTGLELRQEHERDRDGDAVVLGRGIEAIQSPASFAPCERDGVGIIRRREVCRSPVSTSSSERTGTFGSILLAPSPARPRRLFPFTTVSGPALIEEREERVVVGEHVAARAPWRGGARRSSRSASVLAAESARVVVTHRERARDRGTSGAQLEVRRFA